MINPTPALAIKKAIDNRIIGTPPKVVGKIKYNTKIKANAIPETMFITLKIVFFSNFLQRIGVKAIAPN